METDYGKPPRPDQRSIIEILQRALLVEYGIIMHYPRLAEALPDAASRKLLYWIGEQSMRHAEVVSRAIRHLGGEPVYDFQRYPEGKDIAQVMRSQLELEKLARFLFRQALELANDPQLRAEIEIMVIEEEGHIKAVETILERLSLGP